MTKARTSDLKEPRARPQPLDYNFFYDRTRNLTSFMVRNARREKSDQGKSLLLIFPDWPKSRSRSLPCGCLRLLDSASSGAVVLRDLRRPLPPGLSHLPPGILSVPVRRIRPVWHGGSSLLSVANPLPWRGMAVAPCCQSPTPFQPPSHLLPVDLHGPSRAVSHSGAPPAGVLGAAAAWCPIHERPLLRAGGSDLGGARQGLAAQQQQGRLTARLQSEQLSVV
jgi:hypothetical protein